jgi:hypothetical protein
LIFSLTGGYKQFFQINLKIMVSGKGILYTVIGAAGAAVVAGTMLTGGTRSEKMKKIGSGIQNFLGSISRKGLMRNNPQDSKSRAEFNQASGMGHS